VVVEARLTEMRQRESTPEAGRTTAMERVERQLPTFTKASKNATAAAVLRDTLPAPSTNAVGEVYQRLKSILATAAVQQAESSPQHWVEASVLPLARPKDGGQRAAQGTLDAGAASSPVGFSACDHSSRLGSRSEH
jgi:hypothetical protein